MDTCQDVTLHLAGLLDSRWNWLNLKKLNVMRREWGLVLVIATP